MTVCRIARESRACAAWTLSEFRVFRPHRTKVQSTKSARARVLTADCETHNLKNVPITCPCVPIGRSDSEHVVCGSLTGSLTLRSSLYGNVHTGIRVYVLAHKTSKEHLVKAAERSPIRDQAGQAGCEAGVWGVARPQVILRAVAEVEALLEEEGGHA